VSSVRIPADVDREDRLVAGLTARQLGLLAVVGLALAGLWSVTRTLLPTPVFLVAGAPIASVAVVLAIGRRDGLPADRLALAFLRHVTSNRRLVPAPEGVPTLPPDAPRTKLPAPLDLPVGEVGSDGIIDLRGAGSALVCRASSLNFGLRTEAEQRALVAAFGRWLNSLTSPVQVVVRAERVDVASAVAALREDAASLPSVELEEAALDHARFLAELAARRDVLRRMVLLVFRDAAPTGSESLARTATETARALGGAGIAVTPLSTDEARAALGNAMDPDCRPRPAGLSAPDDVISGALG
jgi:hypothetical protein